MDRLLTLQMVEEVTLTPARTLREWVLAGSFPTPLPLPDGRELWRESAIVRWMDLLSAASVQDVDGPWTDHGRTMDGLAGEIMQVLEEANGEWLQGREIARKVSPDVDFNGGSFRRAMRDLKAQDLIETSTHKGYRLTRSGHAPSKKFGQTVDGVDEQ